MSKQRLVLLKVQLNEDTVKGLQREADIQGESFTEITRRAFSIYFYIMRLKRRGGRIFTKSRSGEKRELQIWDEETQEFY